MAEDGIGEHVQLLHEVLSQIQTPGALRVKCSCFVCTLHWAPSIYHRIEAPIWLPPQNIFCLVWTFHYCSSAGVWGICLFRTPEQSIQLQALCLPASMAPPLILRRANPVRTCDFGNTHAIAYTLCNKHKVSVCMSRNCHMNHGTITFACLGSSKVHVGPS